MRGRRDSEQLCYHSTKHARKRAKSDKSARKRVREKAVVATVQPSWDDRAMAAVSTAWVRRSSLMEREVVQAFLLIL